MPDMRSDADWEAFGRLEPYFGVLAADRFRRNNLDEHALEDFFRSGNLHVAEVLDTIRRSLCPTFTPRRVLDFGCGVGRLLVAFSKVAQRVVGVDVSESMLREAEANCRRLGVANWT